MPQDITFTTDEGVTPDDTGDYGTVTGPNNAKQQVVLTALREVGPLEGGPVTATSVDKYAARVRTALRSNPYVDEIRTLRVSDVSEEAVTFEIETTSGAITPSVPRSL